MKRFCISAAAVAAAIILCCGCGKRVALPGENTAAQSAPGADAVAFSDVVTPEAAIETARDSLSGMFDTDTLYFEMLPDVYFYNIDVFTVCDSDDGSERADIGMFYVDRESGEAFVGRGEDKVSLDSFSLASLNIDTSDCRRKGAGEISPEAALAKVREAVLDKLPDEKAEFELCENCSVGGTEYIRVHTYTVRPIMSDDGGLMHYQQYTVGWFYVDSAGRLYTEDYSSGEDTLLVPYEYAHE